MPKGVVIESTRMKVAAKLTAEAILQGKGSTDKEILRRAGYAATTQVRPRVVTKTKSFQALLQQYLPMEKLMQTHVDLLNSAEDGIKFKATELGYKVAGVSLDQKNHAHLHIDAKTVAWGEETPELPPAK